ncbi:hypothetical protein [uncultured Kordia sp.]|uniref:hypothetical protein n=1 Tax=uncultured Kordia sp. TaxID=507699 RepID=UPI0026354D91|nr:hypothetical protein [uncultured Kordia sp.]
MKITKVHNITFDTEETIQSTTFATSNELVMLLSSGAVVRYTIDKQEGEHLFSVKSNFSYQDGGFDINAKTTIYTLDSIVVIVNDYKRHGFVHYPNEYKKLHLWRKDYHADISRYPIALFKNKDNIPHLIYSEAWNHVQIMNLDSRQILTASKSLIEENAEERHLEFYKNYKEDTKLPWPRPLDYFYGELMMSPDNKMFLSAGWAWGSCDAYTVFEVEDFIENPRIAAIHIGGWEHNDRAVCWIANDTVAVAYNPIEEDDEDAHKDSPQEIHLYKIEDRKSEITKKIKVEGLNVVNARIHFNQELNVIVLHSKKQGIALISLEGTVIFHDANIKPDAYDAKTNLFVKTEGKTVTVYQLQS